MQNPEVMCRHMQDGPQKARCIIFAAVVLLWVICGASVAQPIIPLVPDPQDTTSLGNRAPLILIHGWCGGQNGTWGTLAGRFNQDVTLKEQFKIYYFKFDTGGNWAPIPGCPDVNTNHRVERIRTLAQDLKVAVDNLLPDTNRQVAILAHSLGGLIARSYLQEFEIPRLPLISITLATPHHGTLVANDLDLDDQRGNRGRPLYSTKEV